MLEDFLRAWVPLAVSILALIAAIRSIVTAPTTKLAAVIDKLAARVELTEKDVASLKVAVQAMPTSDDFHALDKSVTELRGKIDTISASQRASERSLERIENVLISMASPK